MEQKPSKFYTLLPWLLTLAVLTAFTLYSVLYKSDFNPFETNAIKANLVSAMQIHLLEAVEAEKNAVMAITDEDSEVFADKASQAADILEKNRKEIESIIHKDKFQSEIELLNQFNFCWSQFRKLDETILGLAVQNTNLKAQKISSTQSAQAMAWLEESLNRIVQRNRGFRPCNEAAMVSYEALTAALGILVLHKPHIEETDDPAMDKIEQRIKSYDESARSALRTLSGIAKPSDLTDLKHAQTAYLEFMNTTRDVLRLSRLNTNIKSAGLSLGKKRLIASQCQENLASLQEAFQTQQFNATR